MTTIKDLSAPLQDRIRMDVALLILREDERKANILRCATLRRKLFVEGWADPFEYRQYPVTGEGRRSYHAHCELGEHHPLAAEVRCRAKYQRCNRMEAKIKALAV